jgi:hypothetical protein
MAIVPVDRENGAHGQLLPRPGAQRHRRARPGRPAHGHVPRGGRRFAPAGRAPRGRLHGYRRPATHLLTSTYKFGDLYGRDEHDVEWSLHEFGEQCPDSFTALFDRPQAAYGVDLENRGDVAASSRLRTVIEPYYGYRDEVRVVARQGGCGWGGMALFRGTDDQPFSAEEVAFLATLSEPLATGLRSGLLVRLIGRTRPRATSGRPCSSWAPTTGWSAPAWAPRTCCAS